MDRSQMSRLQVLDLRTVLMDEDWWRTLLSLAAPIHSPYFDRLAISVHSQNQYYRHSCWRPDAHSK